MLFMPYPPEGNAIIVTLALDHLGFNLQVEAVDYQHKG